MLIRDEDLQDAGADACQRCGDLTVFTWRGKPCCVRCYQEQVQVSPERLAALARGEADRLKGG